MRPAVQRGAEPVSLGLALWSKSTPPPPTFAFLHPPELVAQLRSACGFRQSRVPPSPDLRKDPYFCPRDF
jgi:hypothetical protein